MAGIIHYYQKKTGTFVENFFPKEVKILIRRAEIKDEKGLSLFAIFVFRQTGESFNCSIGGATCQLILTLLMELTGIIVQKV